MAIGLLGLAFCLAASYPACARPVRLDAARLAWLRIPPEAGAVAGSENAAIMQPAATDRSDPGFVGMMVRCRAGRLEPVLVIVDPLPPRSVIPITLVAQEHRLDVTGTPIVTGAGLALPVDILRVLRDDWSDEPDLDISIATAEPIRGVVSLKGLGVLAAQLGEDCSAGTKGS